MRSNATPLFRETALLLPSQRELFEYHDRCLIRVEGGVVVAQHAEGALARSYNIPALNTALLLLGPGTSITTEALELLAAANVVVGVSGGMGAPLNAAMDPAFLAITTVSEYLPTEYMQAWVRMWMGEPRKIAAARRVLAMRSSAIHEFWGKLPACKSHNFYSDDFFESRASSIGKVRASTSTAYAARWLAGASTEDLLGQEGQHVQALYHYLASNSGENDWTRDPTAREGVNGLLTMGNYVAYGTAAVALTALGISFAFPLLPGRTRRGGLVLDLADLLKDGVVAPLAFAMKDASEAEFRHELKEALMDLGAISYLVDQVKDLLAADQADASS